MTKRTASRGSVYPRCGCRDQEHRQLGRKCLHLGHPGHGPWSFTVSVAVQGGTSRVRRSGFQSPQDAEAALTQYRQRDRGAAAAGTWTTGRWLQLWLTQRRGVRPSTARSYKSHIRLYLTPALGRIPLDELTSTDVQAMIDAIVDDHATRGRPVSP